MTQTGELAAGASIEIQATITIPIWARDVVLDADSLAVTAVSGWQAAITATAWITTERTVSPAVEFTPNRSRTGTPGAVVNYTHTLTNAGSYTDTFVLTSDSSQGWDVTVTPEDPVTLAGSGTSLSALART